MVYWHNIGGHAVPWINFLHLAIHDNVLAFTQPNRSLLFPPLLYHFAFEVFVRSEVQVARLALQFGYIYSELPILTLFARVFILVFLLEKFAQQRSCVSERSFGFRIGLLVLVLDICDRAAVLGNVIATRSGIHLAVGEIVWLVQTYLAFAHFMNAAYWHCLDIFAGAG